MEPDKLWVTYAVEPNTYIPILSIITNGRYFVIQGDHIEREQVRRSNLSKHLNHRNDEARSEDEYSTRTQRHLSHCLLCLSFLDQRGLSIEALL